MSVVPAKEKSCAVLLFDTMTGTALKVCPPIVVTVEEAAGSETEERS